MRASLYYCNSSTTTVRALSAYRRCTLCSITFICETKCDLEKSTRIISRLPLTISCIIPADGLSGGLWLIWNDDVQVQIIHASPSLLKLSFLLHLFGPLEASILLPTYVIVSRFGTLFILRFSPSRMDVP